MQHRYAVIGLARAGAPAARFLAERGASVVGYDGRELEELSDEARGLHHLGVELRTGEHGFAGLEECSTVVLSPGLKIHHEPLKSVVEACEARGAEVIGELELAYRHCPAPIIAVTGTKGKSTTVKLIEEMLRACGVDAVRAGNTGIPLIAELPKLSPESWAVVEVSSFQLEKAPTFRPRIAALLNLLPDHLDYHPSLEQYWGTKLKIFANQGQGDTAIFNTDDGGIIDRFEAVCDALGERGVDTLLTAAELIVYFDTTQEKTYIDLPTDNAHAVRLLRDDLPLTGEHNLSNLAVAFEAVVAAKGEATFYIHLADVARVLHNFEPLPHRLEVVGTVRGVMCVNDSQATIPEAAMRALEAFPAPVTLIAGGRAKLENADAFDELGRTIAEKAHLLVAIGEAAPRITEAARRASYPQERIVLGKDVGKTLTNAVKQGIIGTPPGGFLVLSPACASFDQFSSFEERGEVFRQTVRQLQNELGS